MKSLFLSIISSLFLLLGGCSFSGNGTTNPTGTTINTPPTAAQISTNAALIQVGTSSAVLIGLSLVPAASQADAKSAATQAQTIIQNDVLTLLSGNATGATTSLSSLLTLNVFSDPKLALIKSLLSTGIVALQSHLQPSLINTNLNKLPPDALAYVVAFFNGANQGLGSYLGVVATTITVPLPPAENPVVVATPAATVAPTDLTAVTATAKALPAKPKPKSVAKTLSKAEVSKALASSWDFMNQVTPLK